MVPGSSERSLRLDEWPNPFATRFTNPTAVRYQFASAHSCAALLERWYDLGTQATIVGPHGCGKSTLLQTLSAYLRGEGEQVVVSRAAPRNPPFSTTWKQTASTGNREMGAEQDSASSWRAICKQVTAHRSRPPIVCVDGWDQVAWWQRQKLRRRFKRQRVRLLLTAHHDTPWPTLCRLSSNAENWSLTIAAIRKRVHEVLSQRVDLCRPQQAGQRQAYWLQFDKLTSQAPDAELSAMTSPSIRDRLFELYDQWEREVARFTALPGTSWEGKDYKPRGHGERGGFTEEQASR